LKNHWNRSMVRRLGPRHRCMSPRDFIKHEPFIWWFAAGIKWAEGVSDPSNLSRWRRDGRPAMTRPAKATRPWRCAKPAVVARRSRLLPALRSTKHNEVFTYGIGAMRGTRLLGSTCGGSKIGERRRRLLPELMASFDCGRNWWKTACDTGG
jgi:hypothetical protein